MTKYSIMAVTREGRPTQKIRTIFVLHPIPYMAYFSFFLFFPNWRVFTEGLSIIFLYCAIRCERTNQTRIETDFLIHFISQCRQHHLILPQDITLLAIRIHGVSARTCCIRGRAVALRLVPLSARTEVVDVAAWG